MKTFFRAAAVSLCVFAGVCSASIISRAEEKAPVVGGYREASVKDKEIISATRFAVQARRKVAKSKMVLVIINGAQKQVVAGMNYRLYFTVKNDGKIQNIVAVVYKDLKGKYSLSSWAAKKDAESNPAK